MSNKYYFEIMKEKINQFESMSEIIENPALKGIANSFGTMLPILYEYISKTTSDSINLWGDKLVEYILSDQEIITKKDIDDIKMIANFTKLYEVVNRLGTNEKLVYFANLFNRTCVDNSNNNDEFNEYLFILNSLSYRTIRIAQILDEFQSKAGIDAIEKYLSSRWEEFVSRAKSEMNIEEYEVYQGLCLLSAFGLFTIFPIWENIGSYNKTGCLTKSYYRMSELIYDKIDK